MGIGWDPSMATSSCDVCGQSVEAWVGTCEDCLEKAGEIFDEVEALELELQTLIQKSYDLKSKFDKFLPDERNNTERMEGYFIRRLERFRDGGEIFAFYQLKEPLKSILGEDEE